MSLLQSDNEGRARMCKERTSLGKESMVNTGQWSPYVLIVILCQKVGHVGQCHGVSFSFEIRITSVDC